MYLIKQNKLTAGKRFVISPDFTRKNEFGQAERVQGLTIELDRNFEARISKDADAAAQKQYGFGIITQLKKSLAYAAKSLEITETPEPVKVVRPKDKDVLTKDKLKEVKAEEEKAKE